MTYMNLLIRYRADLNDTVAEFIKDSREADQWVKKARNAETQGSQSWGEVAFNLGERP